MTNDCNDGALAGRTASSEAEMKQTARRTDRDQECVHEVDVDIRVDAEHGAFHHLLHKVQPVMK